MSFAASTASLNPRSNGAAVAISLAACRIRSVSMAPWRETVDFVAVEICQSVAITGLLEKQEWIRHVGIC